jgi:hypothetical protein
VLKKKAGVVLVTICQVVHDETGKIAAQLGDYGVTETMLDEQQAAIDRFSEVIVMPRKGIIERKGATGALDIEFKRATRILRKMDKVAGMVESSHEEVFRSYRNARTVIDLRGRKKQELFVEGIVKDSRNEVPLSNVRVWIPGTQSIMITNIEGRFKIPVDKDGLHKVMFERQDFRKVLKEVYLNGSREEVVAEMEKEV